MRDGHEQKWRGWNKGLELVNSAATNIAEGKEKIIWNRVILREQVSAGMVADRVP